MALTENGFYYRINKEKVIDCDLQMIIIQKFKDEEHRDDYDVWTSEMGLPVSEKTISGEFLSKPITKFVSGSGLLYFIIDNFTKDTNKTDEDNEISAVYQFIKTFPEYSNMTDLF